MPQTIFNTGHAEVIVSLQWRHTGHGGVSNHQPHHCLLNRLFGCRSKKTSKLRVTGLCAGTSPGTGEFPAQMASNAENVSIWWRNHDEIQNMSQHWDDTDIFFLVENKEPFILHNHYHGCWCPGNARIQGISSQDTDLVCPEYSVFNTKRIMLGKFETTSMEYGSTKYFI